MSSFVAVGAELPPIWKRFHRNSVHESKGVNYAITSVVAHRFCGMVCLYIKLISRL